MYAPNLSAVITTAAAIDFVPANFSGNIYFDEYARVYYAVNGANNNRIIHKTMGYTPRFAGLGTAQLGGGNYQIYPNDNVKMGSATLLLAHRIAVPENGYFKTIAEGLGTPTTYTAVPSNSGSLGSIFYIPKSGNGGVGNFYVYKDTEAEVYKPIYKLVAGLYNLVQGEGYSVSEFLTMSGTTAVADYYYGNGLSGFGVTGGVPEGYMMRLFRGYKAELVLPGSVANDSDPKIYYVSSQDRFYVYQSRNVNSLANDTHGGPGASYTDVFTDARDKTKGFYQLYTRYGKLMINISGAGTGASGKMSVTDLLKMDSYYWTGEELTTAQATTLSIPSDILTNPEYVVPRA